MKNAFRKIMKSYRFGKLKTEFYVRIHQYHKIKIKNKVLKMKLKLLEKIKI